MFIHRKRNVQNGRGLGSILSTIFRKIAPLAKTLVTTGQRILTSKPAQQVIETGKQSLAKAGVQVADDIFQGKNVKQSVKEHLSSAMGTIKDSVMEQAKDQVSKMYGNSEGENRQWKKKKKKKPKSNNLRKRVKQSASSRFVRSKKLRFDGGRNSSTTKGDIFDST